MAASLLTVLEAGRIAVAIAVGVALTSQAESRLVERVGETLLGVGIALVFGVVLPDRRRQHAS